MEAVCRICMDNSVALVDIFEERPSTAEKPSLADMLNECAGCRVKQDDPLPKQICDTCVLDCLNAFRFKRTSQQSQERFMELLNENKEKEKQQQKEKGEHKMQEDWKLSDHSQNVDGKIENQSDSASSDEEILSDDKPKIQQPKLSSSNIINNYNNSGMKISSVTSRKGTIIPITTNSSKLTGKIYCCKLCGKEFLQLDKLAVHKNLHDNELRPFKCPYCPLIFTRSYLLRAHLHTHPQCRPFKCLHCPKTFSRQLQAKEHMCAHKGVHPYQCEKCHKPFKSLAGYRGHVCRVTLKYPN